MAEPRRRLRAVHTSSTAPVRDPDDELAARVRSLEAERLRPVPPPPPLRAVPARRPAAPPNLDDDPAIRALRAAGQKHRQITTQQENGGRL